IDNCLGGVSVSSASLNGTQDYSIDITNSAGIYSFSNTTITDPAAFDGVSSQNNPSASITFTDLNVSTNGSYGIVAIQGGLMRVDGSSRVDANQGAALSLEQTELDMRFESLSSVEDPNEGIYLKEIGGILQVDGPTTVTNSGKSAIRIIDSSGVIDLGSLAIDNTTSNQNGLHATGTIASVSTTGGTVTTGMGVPILVDGQGTPMPLSVLVESVSCDGAANGIVLYDATGYFTVSGDGTTPGSGGTLQATVGNTVELMNAKNISLNLMNIVDSGQNGIDGTGVEGFALQGCEITGAGDGLDEDAISFDDLNQTNLMGQVEILNSRISGMAHHGIDIENFSGSVASLLIQS
ncbi:MAG: hypothetical protein KC978_24605, partial [Candidatus Omnitrophica bacterium]|nr:hypothetical protein [Candidatus Omnitrophota bacterium]